MIYQLIIASAFFSPPVALVAGTVVSGYYYGSNIYKSMKNIVYGYADVKCCNKQCAKIIKISRSDNNLTNNDLTNNNYYACGMGCAFQSYNQDCEDKKKEEANKLQNEPVNEPANEPSNIKPDDNNII
jgi:hypothetical protein